MKFTIDTLILWPVNPENDIQEISFKNDKINIIHGISGTGKSSIASIIDYCLGSSKCAIPVGLIRESVIWFGLKVDIHGYKYLIARKTPGNKTVSNEYHLNHFPAKLPDSLTVTHTNNGFKNKFNQLVNLSDLPQSEENEPVGFDGRASFRDMAAFNFLPQHIVANPYTLFFKADSYQNKERLQRVMPFALGIIDREYMIKEKERTDLQKRIDSLLKQQFINKKALSSWTIDIDRLWIESIELGLAPASEKYDIDSKITALRLVNKTYLEGNINKLLGTPNYEYTNKRIKYLTAQCEQTQKNIDMLRIKIRNFDQLLSKGNDFAQAVKKEKEHIIGFKWLKDKIAPEGKCIACGSKTNALLTVVDNLERHVSKINIMSDVLFDNPIADKELIKAKKELRDYQDELSSLRKEKLHLEKIDKGTNDSLNKIYVLIGKIQETLSSLNKVKNTDDVSEQITQLNKPLNLLNNYFLASNKESRESLIYSEINTLIEKYSDEFKLERRGNISLDKKELTLSFKENKNSRSEYLWEVGSGANWMGYHISSFLAFHEFLSHKDRNHLPPFSFLVIDQPSQVYFPSTASGENTLDNMSSNENIKITRQSDIIATRRIFEILSKAIKENNYYFQVIVLEHADKSIWGKVENTYEAACWKDEGDGLIPRSWLN
ncbi:DUF3732 domain-containing protein [Buttiauxella noackiae]|uniref:DUF3732 domain-containing protein n=1 Tax=Buttiauxella noackiae TaxID=82992 RepID=UPI000551A452|nr:DUF3732 domain-containing protein [Buttiauxella noackiae]